MNLSEPQEEIYAVICDGIFHICLFDGAVVKPLTLLWQRMLIKAKNSSINKWSQL